MNFSLYYYYYFRFLLLLLSLLFLLPTRAGSSPVTLLHRHLYNDQHHHHRVQSSSSWSWPSRGRLFRVCTLSELIPLLIASSSGSISLTSWLRIYSVRGLACERRMDVSRTSFSSFLFLKNKTPVNHCNVRALLYHWDIIII